MINIIFLIWKVIVAIASVLLSLTSIGVAIAAIVSCRDKGAKFLITISFIGWFILGFLCGRM